MVGSKADFDNVTIFGDDEDPESDDGRTIAMSIDDNQTVWDDNDDNETVLEAPTVVADSGPCQCPRKKKKDAEALLFERFKLLVQKGQSSLEKESPPPAAERASSSSAAASSQSHQPHVPLQPCAKRKERKRNRREMDEDTGVWKEYFTSHRHYEKEVLGKKKGRGGKKWKDKLHKRR